MKRKGKLWIRIFPDKPVTKKPLEVRMGKGKGALEYWVAVVRPGRMLFEMDGVPEALARESLRLAAAKLPDHDAVRAAARAPRDGARGTTMKATELRELTDEELGQRYREAEKELFNLRMQQATGQLEKPSRLRDCAARWRGSMTVMNERKGNAA